MPSAPIGQGPPMARSCRRVSIAQMQGGLRRSLRRPGRCDTTGRSGDAAERRHAAICSDEDLECCPYNGRRSVRDVEQCQIEIYNQTKASGRRRKAVLRGLPLSAPLLQGLAGQDFALAQRASTSGRAGISGSADSDLTLIPSSS